MARKSGQKTRSCTFRLPEDRYEVLAEVAKERGIDVSAVLNMIVSDAVPQLTEWLHERKSKTDDPLVETARALSDLQKELDASKAIGKPGETRSALNRTYQRLREGMLKRVTELLESLPEEKESNEQQP